jgi:hypothetical protein
MKKILFASFLALTMMSTAAFAAPNDRVDEQISASFQNDFVSAKHVLWEKCDDYSKATFTMDGQVMYAYYSNDAKLLGVVRNITSDKLPIGLFREIKKNYNDHWISNLFEMSADGSSSYYITLEDADEVLVYKSNGSDGWDLYKRTKKS